MQRVITDLAVLDVTDDGFLLRETAPDVTVDDVRAATAADLHVADDVGEMALSATARGEGGR